LKGRRAYLKFKKKRNNQSTSSNPNLKLNQTSRKSTKNPKNLKSPKSKNKLNTIYSARESIDIESSVREVSLSSVSPVLENWNRNRLENSMGQAKRKYLRHPNHQSLIERNFKIRSKTNRKLDSLSKLFIGGNVKKYASKYSSKYEQHKKLSKSFKQFQLHLREKDNIPKRVTAQKGSGVREQFNSKFWQELESPESLNQQLK
jgi:hypothetical protein